MMCSGRERSKGQEENNGERNWRCEQGQVPETWGPWKGFGYHYVLSSLHSQYLPAFLLSESICLDTFLTEPLDGFLNWRASGNCPNSLICGLQKYLHDMNKVVKTKIVSGPSLNIKFQMLGIMEKELQGGYPLELFPSHQLMG